MKAPRARVLVVDDYDPWYRFVRSTLQKFPEFLIVGEASDGLAAVEKAKELQPDLILLDIGLPKLNGIEAARRISKVAPKSKILFISENRSWEIAQEALRTGAGGYMVKSDAARELLPAIRAVLRGKRFVSASFADHDLGEGSNGPPAGSDQKAIATSPSQKNGSIRGHQAGLYSNEACLLDDATEFIGAALKAGNAAVVVAIESHRDNLFARLQAQGLDVERAIVQGRYLAVDAATTFATFMTNGTADLALYLKAFGDLIRKTANASKQKHPRVAVFGEGAGLLWARGKLEALIQIERVSNRLLNSYDVDLLCAYFPDSVPGGMQNPAFQPICAEHSAVRSR